MSYFSGLIYCGHCNFKFKKKTERGKVKFLCSNYDKNGKEFCERHAIYEDKLWKFVRGHFPFQELSEDEMISKVEKIEIKSAYEFKIFYKDGTKGESGLNFFRYL